MHHYIMLLYFTRSHKTIGFTIILYCKIFSISFLQVVKVIKEPQVFPAYKVYLVQKEQSETLVVKEFLEYRDHLDQ